MCELLKTRRSVRKYRPEQVPDELLDAVLEAGLYAPSAMNNQKPVMVAVRDKATRDQLSAMNAAVLGTDRDPFYGAPAILIVLAEKDWPNRVYDGSLVMGNLMLAAHSLGLGSIWIHRAREEFELPEGQQLLKELNIPGQWEGIGHCAVGYIDGEAPAAAKRKAGRVFWAE